MLPHEIWTYLRFEGKTLASLFSLLPPPYFLSIVSYIFFSPHIKALRYDVATETMV
jgi:hypothetical protein